MELQDELQTLARADEDLRHAEKRIERRERLIEELRCDGHDVAAALDLLSVLRDTRSAMRDHRQLIAENIDRLKCEQRRY